MRLELLSAVSLQRGVRETLQGKLSIHATRNERMKAQKVDA